MKAVDLDNIWEKYRIKFVKGDGVVWQEVWALREINLEVKQGEVLGVIGQNGSGKTTLLKIIAGMLMPDQGKINVRGKVSTLMELGAGFNREFTGRENISLNARMYGLNKKDINTKMREIIEFAGLGEFIDAPIKYYSQGMYLRLAFSLAISLDPDILLIDDIIAVGDESSTQRCIGKIQELKKAGKTIILVSHQMDMIAQMCNRVVHLNEGKIIDAGLPKKVISAYLETAGEKKGIKVFEKDKFRVVFNNGWISLSYDGVSLTNRMGGYAVWFNPRINAWVNSKDLGWRVKTKDGQSFVFEGSQEGFDSLQIWTLSLKKDLLEWKIELKGGEIKDPHFDFGFAAPYDHWITEDREESFSPFISRLNWQDLGIHDCPSGGVGMFSQQGADNLPGFIFGKGKRSDKVRLFNTGYHDEARVVQHLFDSKFAGFYIRVFSEKENLLKHLKKEKKEDFFANKPYLLEHKKIRVKADAREKTVRIYYQDKEVTAGCGISASFQKDGIWYDAGAARWRLSRQGESIRGELFWSDFGLGQNWKLGLKDGRIIWEADTSIPDGLKIDSFKLGLLINKAYKSYFCGHQESVFPDEFSRWLDMNLEDEQADFLGVKASGSLPAIVLSNKGGRINVIENSDKENRCRSLQLRLSAREFKEQGFSSKIQLFKDNRFIDKYRQKKRALLPQTLFFISKGQVRVSLDTEAKKIRIFYKDKEITERACLRNNLATSKKSFESGALDWRIGQVTKDRAVLNMGSWHFPVVQRWEFFCRKDNSLKISINLEIQKKVAIIDKGLSFELKDSYRAWESSSEKGTFAVRDYQDNIGAIRMRDSSISAIYLESKNKRSFPDLTFYFKPAPWNRIVNLYKRRQSSDYGCCIGLYTTKLLPRKRTVFKPGVYNLLEGEIIFGKKAELNNSEKEVKKIKLVKPGLELIFGQGKGRLYCKGKEITSGLGMHTSFCHFGIWYDSSLAAWEVLEQVKMKVTAVGDWVHLPVSQVWKIELTKGNQIVWEIKTEIRQELELKAAQSNLMLSSLYKEWIVPQASQGVFSEFFTDEYDILPFRFWSGPARELVAQSRQLPKVSFKQNQADGSQQGLLENSDYFYRARLLQYQYIGPRRLKAGNAGYFKGVIEIEPKKN